MTNYEKYKDELIKHVIAQSYIGLDINTNNIAGCSDLCCERCKFNENRAICNDVDEMMMWLNSEYIEPKKEEVDWSKVPIDTKILVSDDNKNWYRRHFAYYRDKRIGAFNNGVTSWTTNDLSETSGWEYGKLLEDEE